MGPDLWELYEYGEASDEVAAILRLGHYNAVPAGVRVVTQFEEIVTVRLSRADIPKVSGAPEVDGMISGDGYLGPDLELDAEADTVEGLPAARMTATDERRPLDLPVTGRGIVIGVVDWGFDIAHADFRRPDGTSRVLALWDQRGTKHAKSPSPFGYGIVHTTDAINAALHSSDPYAVLGYHPADADTGIGCHGTHVASIAAGSGGEAHPAGLAPEADLVFVHNAPWDGLESGKLGDSVTLLEAIDFIARTADGRPWVINLSMGRHGEQHDGTTLIEQGLDAAVRMSPGRAICLSAGNYYNKRVHAAGQLRPTQQRSFAWVINERKPSDYNQLEIWYSWQDRFEVSVRSPDGSVIAQARLGEKVKLLAGGKEIGNLYHRAQVANSLDHHLTVYLYKNATPGEWTITIRGVDVIHGHYHAWIEREVSCPRCQSHFRAEDADPTSTTGTICNGKRTIAVGAYNFHDPTHRMGAFSSVGPTRDGRLKPDLCAPGVQVLAARSAPYDHADQAPTLTRMSGTSMAAPHVTGALALAFQAAVRPLKIEETRNLLLGNTRRESVPEDNPDRLGIGMLDVRALIDAASHMEAPRGFHAVPASIAKPTAVAPTPLDAESIGDAELEVLSRSDRKAPAVGAQGPQPIDAEAEDEAGGAGDREALLGGLEPAVEDLHVPSTSFESLFESTDLTEAVEISTRPEDWFLTAAEIRQARGGAEIARAGAPFTSKNRVEALIDGAQYMQALHDDLIRTREGDFFHLTAFRLNITQDLLPMRPANPASPSRLDNLVKELASRRKVACRALIYQAVASSMPYADRLPNLEDARQTRENAQARNWWNAAGGTGVIDGRYPLLGSHHQKSAIVQRDGETVAYCGGIDLCPDRWDMPSHDDDPRRTREKAAGWHDVHLRLRGPAALEIESNFRERWNAKNWPVLKPPPEPPPAPITSPLPPVAAAPGTHHVQILRTYACARNHYPDFAPFGELTCLAGYLKAIEHARRYIYIEDQYLVSHELSKALLVALGRIEALIIVIPARADVAVERENYHQAAFIERLRAAHPTKVHVFHLIQTKSGEQIYVHAKLMIVDDVYAVVGSPNVNRRSMTHDTEIAAAIVDADVVDGTCRFARELRLRLWAEHLETTVADPALQDPVAAALGAWDAKARTAKERVRYHVTPMPRNNFPAAVWSRGVDPDGRCGTLFASEGEMEGEGEYEAECEACVASTEAIEIERTLARAEAQEAALAPMSRLACDLFEAFAYRGRCVTALPGLLDRFELVAAPGAAMTLDVRAGDWLVRRGDTGTAYVSLLTGPPLARDDFAGSHATLELKSPGHYVQVRELDARGRGANPRQARRLTDARGLVPLNQLVLRVRDPVTASSDAIESMSEAGDTPPDTCHVIEGFAFDRAELSKEHQPRIEAIARDIKQRGIRAVSIVGHASREGTDGYNEGLAMKRATSVANALAAVVERQEPGASARVSLLPQTRGKREQISEDQRKNRRVEVCFAAGTSPAGIEARLRALLTASMVLAGNSRATFTPGGTFPTTVAATGRLWHYTLFFGVRGTLEARDVTCRVEHVGGHTMAMPVLEHVRWENPVVSLPGGARVTLELGPRFLLGSFHSPSGRLAAATHAVWRLASDHDQGTAVVFGFDLTQPTQPAPLTRLEDFTAGAGKGRRVLACCELVGCGKRKDFEPGEVLEAARLYPIAEILTDADASDIAMAIYLERPDRSPMDHGWFGGGKHATGLFTDRNVDQGLIAFVSKALTGNAAALPTWGNMFDYVDRNTGRSHITGIMVNPALTSTRTNTTERESFDRDLRVYAPTTVSKEPRQGEFDSVHIAPPMQVSLPSLGPLFSGLGPLGVTMAPLCSHDCFHLHWRWGKGYTKTHVLGWGPSGPYTLAGAPMVAPNQRIDVETPAGLPAMRYRALASVQRGGEWAYVMPHGCAYALKLMINPSVLLERALNELPAKLSIIKDPILRWVASKEDRSWAWVYFLLQYSPSMSAPHYQEVLRVKNPIVLRRL